MSPARACARPLPPMAARPQTAAAPPAPSMVSAEGRSTATSLRVVAAASALADRRCVRESSAPSAAATGAPTAMPALRLRRVYPSPRAARAATMQARHRSMRAPFLVCARPFAVALARPVATPSARLRMAPATTPAASRAACRGPPSTPGSRRRAPATTAAATGNTAQPPPAAGVAPAPCVRPCARASTRPCVAATGARTPTRAWQPSRASMSPAAEFALLRSSTRAPPTRRQAPASATAPGRCVGRPAGCITLFDPVCGCDGRTYNNACTAASVGVRVAARGACSTSTDAGVTSRCALVRCAAGYTCCARPGSPQDGTCFPSTCRDCCR
jgi:hypothetical protein